ncbi:restriction endonuclease subunit S [Rothia sp. HMSC069C04]|uniref:restriction endonuclease subunit S n=1 Tax=Rothia sp. HMSC069C04 TaxID=1739383 RepID=UPI0009F4C0DB|nr:restriction endonuclease subunit S [Rothia sp. HMSC069C04]
MAVLSDAQRDAGWTIAKLGDITTKIGSGSTPRGGKSSYVDEGPMVIRSQNVLDNELDLSDVAHVPEELTAKLKSVLVQKGDTLLNITGSGNTTIGRSALVNEDLGEAYVNQHVCIIRPNKSLVNEIFLQKSIFAFKDELLGLSYGSTRDALTKGIIESFEIPLPPLKEQERIAGILGSLDDKIEANTRLIQTLDSLGEAATRKYLKSVQKTQKLNDIAHIVMGQSPKGETLNTEGSGVLFFQGKKDFGFRYPTPRTYTTAATRMAEPLDILFSVRAPIGALNRSVEACCVGRGLAAIRSSCGQENTLFYTLKTNPNLWEKFEGEGTIFSAINKKGLSELDIPFSETAISNGVEDFLTSVEQEIFSLEQENLQLAETRDALIKRLIG